VVTAEFTEEGGKTRLTATVQYPSLDVRDGVIASGMARGAAISYDRLEDLVASCSDPDLAIEPMRRFARDLIYPKAITSVGRLVV
jgi:hypothetical protein